MHKKAVGAGEFYVGKIFSSIQQEVTECLMAYRKSAKIFNR